MNKKIRKTIVITLITIIILCLAVTSAYFAMSVSNTNNEKINNNSAQLSIVYTDCASSKQSDCANMTKNLGLGESFEKTFKVYNNGTLPVDYKIIFKELTNTFQNGDLVYTIKDLNDNVLQSERPVPYASVQTTNVNAYLDNIAANTTKEFKIVVKLKETTSDQTVNASATYAIKLGLTTQNGGTDGIYNLVSDADPNTTDVITKTAPTGEVCTNTLAYDNTVDNNLRYVGVDPCNYVSFNNELWRIIGVMNNIDDGNGSLATRLKIIRNDSLGEYSKDSSDISIYDGYGLANWYDADLMYELNGDYLDTTLTANTTWYSGINNLKDATFNYQNVLNSESQALIGNAKYYLGLGVYGEYTLNGTPQEWYNYERNNNLSASRNSFWVGKIGLVYPSDYGFAGADTNAQSNNLCLNNLLFHYSYYSACYSNYIFKNKRIWTITPYYHNERDSFIIDITGDVRCEGSSSTAAYNTIDVFPVLYLNQDVKISGGNGSINSPYTLA